MNQKLIIGIIVAVLVVGGVAAYAMSQSKNEVASDQMTEDKMMTDDKTNSDDAMMADKKTEDDKMMSEDKTTNDAMPGDTMMKAGSYEDYSPSKIASEHAEGNKVVLFFHATWCPYCKAANAAFTSRASEIPAGVTVLKTDYDSNDELKKKYGVTYQHTFVQVDASGNMITKWNGGDIDALKQNIK